MNRSGLGKGLSALIPTGARSLEEIPVDQIAPNPAQPRRHFDEEGLTSLAASIRQLGLLQPVVVRRTEAAGFELVMGERRWRAARRAGLRDVPAIVVETDDRGALERAIVENIHRQDLNPLEEAAAYKQLLEEAGLTHEQLAERVGLSRPAVSNSLRLLDLPEDVQRMVLEGRLSGGHARALLGMSGNPLLIRTAQRVAAEQLSVRQTEELVRATREHSPAEGAQRAAERPSRTSAVSVEISERLSDLLGTRVSVVLGRRKGKVTVEFGSTEDLERLVEVFERGARRNWAG